MFKYFGADYHVEGSVRHGDSRNVRNIIDLTVISRSAKLDPFVFFEIVRFIEAVLEQLAVGTCSRAHIEYAGASWYQPSLRTHPIITSLLIEIVNILQRKC